jgi:hypothetical protein
MRRRKIEAMKPSCTNSYAHRGQRTIAQPFEKGHDE